MFAVFFSYRPRLGPFEWLVRKTLNNWAISVTFSWLMYSMHNNKGVNLLLILGSKPLWEIDRVGFRRKTIFQVRCLVKYLTWTLKMAWMYSRSVTLLSSLSLSEVLKQGFSSFKETLDECQVYVTLHTLKHDSANILWYESYLEDIS